MFGIIQKPGSAVQDHREAIHEEAIYDAKGAGRP
jgi:hypothetical protein